jgi:hypothetical protein
MVNVFPNGGKPRLSDMSQTLKATLVAVCLLYCAAGSVVAEPSEGGFQAFEGGN